VSDHPSTLTTRNNIAGWTGECGDAREALRLFQALLPDQERVLGRDHPETLRTRQSIDHLSLP
jgi:Tetratricopeptide repeat